MSDELRKEQEVTDSGLLVGCAHGGGSLIPANGNWTNAIEEEESERLFQCFECGDLVKVTRKNIAVEEIPYEEYHD